jgi:hypothetical protein
MKLIFDYFINLMNNEHPTFSQAKLISTIITMSRCKSMYYIKAKSEENLLTSLQKKRFHFIFYFMKKKKKQKGVNQLIQ